ncbi:hypothetical protein BDF21DRAFT_172678 [Thamnidium elegans]|nr:hypothetical protein BDF21DRAFT_172678 [Thamnidium elegans]
MVRILEDGNPSKESLKDEGKNIKQIMCYNFNFFPSFPLFLCLSPLAPLIFFLPNKSCVRVCVSVIMSLFSVRKINKKKTYKLRTYIFRSK